MNTRHASDDAGTPETARPMVEPEPAFPPQRQNPPGLESELDPQPRWRAERYREAGKLEGQKAVITGGDSGIGRAVAYLFAREGADVLISCLSEEQSDAEQTQQAVESVGRRCDIVADDLVTREACDTLIDRAIETLGRIDILVHNAAWQNRKPITELTEQELERTYRTNVYAYLRLCRAAVPHMKPGASIIATGSSAGLRGSSNLSDYSGTKAAIHAITKSLAIELLDRGIRVNCVATGPVWTPLNPSDTGLSEEDVSVFGQGPGASPMSRPAQPEEIAPAFVYFASEADSSFATGVILTIEGGPG